MARNRGYGSYRGRASFTDILKWIAIALAILILAAIGLLVWGQQYLVSTDKGIQFRPPFLEFFHPASSSEDVSNDFSIIVDTSGSQSQSQTPDPEPEPEPEPVLTAAAAALEAAADGSALQQVTQAGGNAIILEMKSPQGRLAWQTENSMAVQAGAVSSDNIDAQLEALGQGETPLIALFDCFQDHALAASESYAISSNSGYKWTDPDKVRWSSPTNPLVQDYQVSLMVELAELGFDEIVLQNWGYPDEGNLNWIRVGEAYDPNQLDQIVESFLAKARRALEPYGVKLSVMVSPAVLSGENLLSGQTGAAIDRWTDRVWVRPNSPEDDLDALLTQAGITNSQERLVRIADTLDLTSERPQAALTPVGPAG